MSGLFAYQVKGGRMRRDKRGNQTFGGRDPEEDEESGSQHGSQAKGGKPMPGRRFAPSHVSMTSALPARLDAPAVPVAPAAAIPPPPMKNEAAASVESLLPEVPTFADCKRLIDACFVRQGIALRYVRDLRLYKEVGYQTFEACCQKEWDLSSRRVNQIIRAAEVVLGLGKHVSQMVTNERQANALGDVPEESRAEVLSAAQATAPGGKLTARHIKETAAKAVQENAMPPTPDEEDLLIEADYEVVETAPEAEEIHPEAPADAQAAETCPTCGQPLP